MNQVRLMMFRVRAGKAEAYFEGALSDELRTYLAISYVNECLAKIRDWLTEDCWAQQFECCFAFQTTDTAFSDVRSLGVGRRRGGMEAVHLVPDFYFVHHRAYANLRRAVAERRTPQWSERADLVFWRGSTTGWEFGHDIGELPRIRLALMCKGIAHTDVAIMGVAHMTVNYFPIPAVEKFVRDNGIQGDRIPMLEHGRFKYAIDIDGLANAWSFIEKLLLGCCVLKVDSPFEQWFYDRIKPWEHFVPVRGDLSDLAERIQWCLENERRCGHIAATGAAMAESLTFESQVEYGARQILKVALTDAKAPEIGHDPPGSVRAAQRIAARPTAARRPWAAGNGGSVGEAFLNTLGPWRHHIPPPTVRAPDHALYGADVPLPSEVRLGRVRTHWGTVIFADLSSGTLRHGLLEFTPQNVLLGTNDGTAYLFHVLPVGDRYTIHVYPAQEVLGTESVHRDSVAQSPPFQVVLAEADESPMFGLRRCDLFLCAEGDGRITLSRGRLGPWERFELIARKLTKGGGE